MSQKRTIAIAIAAILLFACTAAMASTNAMGIAEKQSIAFSAPTLVGGTVLPAGQYNVTHQMNGKTHVMIFKQVNGKAEAKTNCSLVPLKAKAEHTSQRFTVNATNDHVLEEITFEGDKASHVLAQ
jgi:FlaG/FlaF family flagellin (archaellin)